MSDRGIAFATSHADASFVAGFDLEVTKDLAERVRPAAEDAAAGWTATAPLPSLGPARIERRSNGCERSTRALTSRPFARSQGANRLTPGRGTINEIHRGMIDKGSSIFTPALVGSPDTIVEQFRWLSSETALDGVMLTFPDWYADLDAFGRDVSPRLQEEGLIRR